MPRCNNGSPVGNQKCSSDRAHDGLHTITVAEDRKMFTIFWGNERDILEWAVDIIETMGGKATYENS